MGKVKKAKQPGKDSGLPAMPKAVKQTIGKVKSKTSKAKAPTSVAKAVAEGPQSRRAFVAAVSAARAEGGKVLKSLLGPRPKMNGARMMQEIEEARAHAEQVADVAHKKGRSRKKKLSAHSRGVLAAFNASRGPV
ncbi:unnamed protein product [Durusdinium trenchii]|uniref:Uncharacterized protein n=1 Tax=Durusdinium trenchii TaxID=1381693 RepID=A0ABP0NYZ7_9DINO